MFDEWQNYISLLLFSAGLVSKKGKYGSFAVCDIRDSWLMEGHVRM